MTYLLDILKDLIIVFISSCYAKSIILTMQKKAKLKCLCILLHCLALYTLDMFSA